MFLILISILGILVGMLGSLDVSIFIIIGISSIAGNTISLYWFYIYADIDIHTIINNPFINKYFLHYINRILITLSVYTIFIYLGDYII